MGIFEWLLSGIRTKANHWSKIIWATTKCLNQGIISNQKTSQSKITEQGHNRHWKRFSSSKSLIVLISPLKFRHTDFSPFHVLPDDGIALLWLRKQKWPQGGCTGGVTLTTKPPASGLFTVSSVKFLLWACDPTEDRLQGCPWCHLLCIKDVTRATFHDLSWINSLLFHPSFPPQTDVLKYLLSWKGGRERGRAGEGRQRKERECPLDFLCAIAAFSFHFKNKIPRSVFFTAFLCFLLPQTLLDFTVLSFDFNAPLK